jgi:4-phytase/acid phosphatase
MVVVVSRHGVRSPTDPNELSPYAAKPWPAWQVPPGNLTAHGATLMTAMGASYRSFYSAAGLLPSTVCPASEALYVWADVDERTEATAAALLDGLAPGCGFAKHDIGASVDPLFHALPTLGKADPVTSSASIAGSVGGDPQAVVPAYGAAFAKLDAILGCGAGPCRRVSNVAMSFQTSSKTGLVSLEGAVGLASTAVEDFILAYADGKPASEVGWGAIDRATLLELSQLHCLKSALTTQTPYEARAVGSNLLAHVLATIDQGAAGVRDENTRAPLSARFVAFVGHDTNLEALAGLLRLRWLMPGYQPNDTPPGGALVFEIHKPGIGPASVRLFYTAQSLDQMRSLSPDPPARVPVFVPGCPTLDCPIATFDRIVNASIDPAFVGSW